MKLLEKILLPVDVNREDNEQIDSAVRIAKEFHSEVTLMYVLPDTDLHPEVEKLLRKYIGESFGRITKTLEEEKIAFAEPITEKGNPVNRILEAATDHNANLILVSSGAKTENDKFKLGTTAEKLIQLSDVPVWVSKAEQHTDIKKIICPVDFSDPSKRALRNAILLRNHFDSTLHILSVAEPSFASSAGLELKSESETENQQKEFEEKMKTFLSDFNLEGIDHVVEISRGTPHLKILKSIEENNIDLLVMGTNGLSGFSRMFMGSVTEKVIRELPCTFVTTKTQNIYQLRLDDEVKGIEIHFSNAAKLQKSGLFNEAIEQYLICLQINDMHVPSMYKLAELYKLMGNTVQMEYYDKMASDILRRLWDKKIEFEIRRHYKSDG